MILRLAITPGEPAGIGLDLVIQIAQHGSPYQLIAYADPKQLKARAQLLDLPLELVKPGPISEPTLPGQLYIQPIPSSCISQPGTLNAANARYVLDTLEAATQDCLINKIDALVTGPVHKGIINESGIPFTGHTEFLATMTDTQQVVMMLASDTMRVALVTTHLPLRQVADTISAELLESVITILHHDLCHHFAIQDPHILVCGLNPHAGEGGHLGHEETDIIAPVLQKLQGAGMHLTGPLPADTAFTEHNVQHCDAILAMYHDQGLPVLKHAGFGRSVNITLGLPIIRTSVDHGTALELAALGTADTGSLLTAINYAADMAISKAQALEQDSMSFTK